MTLDVPLTKDVVVVANCTVIAWIVRNIYIRVFIGKYPSKLFYNIYIICLFISTRKFIIYQAELITESEPREAPNDALHIPRNIKYFIVYATRKKPL
jgi:hypothetical protein